jgi:hypothetical protein
MKLLMELFSKNSSTGEAELCQTGPIYMHANKKIAGLVMLASFLNPDLKIRSDLWM